MNTTRTDGGGQSAGTTVIVVDQINKITKVKISNPSPETVRTDGGGQSAGTTTQQAESSGTVVEQIAQK